MSHRSLSFIALLAGAVLAVTPALAASAVPAAAPAAAPVAAKPSPGAPGIGDPYFPLSGNGGYDVKHYGLNIDYVPATDVLTGHALITAKATQNLSRFDLDLHGLTVKSITVNGRKATWKRSGDELVVTPASTLRKGFPFFTTVSYAGVPQLYEDSVLGTAGFYNTDDGTLVAGQPFVAASWFPSNDHPADKALYSMRITVPRGVEAISNGKLLGHGRIGTKDQWIWNVDEPMASYLATATIGQFDVDERDVDGIHYLDAIDPDLFAAPVTPRTGTAFAYTQKADDAYKRLGRTIAVPAAGGSLSFWMDRSVEQGWDFTFVEAAPTGTDEWTTLPESSGITTPDAGNSGCADLLAQHPFLAHYLGDDGSGDACLPSGTTGTWSAATGSGDGWELWTIDLGDYAGQSVDLSIASVSDYAFQADGVALDDVTGPDGQGTTSFEADADPLDGWTVLGAPEGSPGNLNDWIATSEGPAPIGDQVSASLAREPEVIGFLSAQFGPYPFDEAGGIVDDLEGIGFALENQTRPIYDQSFFSGTPEQGDGVVVHELAHQWFGDDVALKRWSDIWLNEGFATYAEWLWAEHEGYADPQAYFDDLYSIPADDDFWSLTIGDPGPDAIFDGAVYDRGAMTVHALRLTVGDDAFFDILQTWTRERSGGNGTTAQFIALAESISGTDLDGLFTAWLFTGEKPTAPDAASDARSFEAPGGQTKLLTPSHPEQRRG
ncbi:M1 family metallopeptidase [Leifsonia flava]|uniref:M1 family metallopeptidase n=1 Tax=Orlajensenia leifsoniae TaxID=2561933 RepID=UPI0014300AB3|nr:M1 family metallopeptidase [Leifsonia flava]